MRFNCHQCGARTNLPSGHVNRSRKQGNNLYCGRACSGLGRRIEKDKAQKVAEKKAYDAEYRVRNRAMLKAKKHAHFKRTYDPAKAAVERKAKMPRHVVYCRQPGYRAKKHIYDVRRYHEKTFGPLADVSMLLRDLVSNINQRITDYETRSQNQAVRNPQTRAAQESVRIGRDRDRSTQGQRA